MAVKKEQKTHTEPRSPVVVIMGHIDHGKTTLLDYIRSTNVVAREDGSITQHIGAYEVEHNGQRITFLDTPGHESFSRMRARGARVADIAVLVVAADDGVKPQTIEAIRVAKEAGIPFLVAINKIDKPEADVNRVKGELAEHDVLLEGWGGSVPVVEISAKTGEGVSELQDLILLAIELEELTAVRENAGSGVVIESFRDSRRGVVVTLLIKDGTVRKGDCITSGKEVAAIRIMEDSKGENVQEASFSSPIRVLGFTAPPTIGDTFMIYATMKDAAAACKKEEVITATTNNLPEQDTSEENENQPADGREVLVVPLIIKADVAGSREALEGEIEKFNGSFLSINILRSDIGDITDDDIKSVSGTKGAIIIGFKVKTSSSAQSLAKRYDFTIHTSDIIYELLDWLRAELERRIPAEVTRTEDGKLQILKVFKKDGNTVVFGGKVVQGVIRNGTQFDVLRGDEIQGTGTITNTQRNKVDAKEITVGFECGLAAQISGTISEGDTIVAFTETKTKTRL
jgi:translation initiation factor IF-2